MKLTPSDRLVGLVFGFIMFSAGGIMLLEANISILQAIMVAAGFVGVLIGTLLFLFALSGE